MIDWIIWDVSNPPPCGSYLVYDGVHFDIAILQDDIGELNWYAPDLSSVVEEDVTHYAYITLPGKEKQEA